MPHIRPGHIISRIKIFMISLLLGIAVLGLRPAVEAGSRKSVNPNKLTYKPLSFQPPKAERITLENGMIVYLLEDHELPVVNLTMAIRTGSMYDPAGKEGLAELTSGVMRTGGAGGMSGSAIDDALEFVAASIESSSSMENTNWSLGTMKKDLDQALVLFAKIVREPSFDEPKLKLAKDLKLEELRRIYDDPQKLAFGEFNRLLYRDNARGRLPSPASINNLVKADLVSFHQQYYFPQNMMIAMTGDITRAEVVEKLNASFGKWNKTGQVNSIPLPVRKPADTIYYIVKDTPQSIVITGQLAPKKASDEYYPFEALNFIIGSGGFRSRIFQEIRTNRGLAYSTGSFYRSRSDYGVFGTYAMTKTDSAPMVLSLIKLILEKAKQSAPAQQELERAKNAIINSFIFEYQSARQIAGQQMMLEFNKLPADFLTIYCNRISSLLAHDLLKAGSDHLQPESMTILVLGTAEGYEKMKRDYPKIEKLRTDYHAQ